MRICKTECEPIGERNLTCHGVDEVAHFTGFKFGSQAEGLRGQLFCDVGLEIEAVSDRGVHMRIAGRK